MISGPDGRHDSARHGSLTPSQGGGSGRVADPVQRDGMRAPPGTEATPTSQFKSLLVDPRASLDEAVVNEEVIVLDVKLDAAFSPSGFTGQSSRLFLLVSFFSIFAIFPLTHPSELSVPPKFRQHSAPGSV